MVALNVLIKDIDDDHNGFLAVHELEDCFREHFAPELEGKSLVYFFRRWSTDHDKDMINYRRIKETIMSKVHSFQTPMKESHSSRFGAGMGRSGTQSSLHSEIKKNLGFGSSQKNTFESYVNKPMKTNASVLVMEKMKQQPDFDQRSNGSSGAKLPTLNRYNVRALASQQSGE